MLKGLAERIYQYRARQYLRPTRRKMIIFCSDDWGGARVRSTPDQEALTQAGIKMDSNRFDMYDTLESNADLELLFEVLEKYKDHLGNHPVITAVSNVANPDFARIKDDEFTNYYYETTAQTLQRYPAHDRVMDLYREGIRRKIFMPEYHGREHVQVARWLRYLRTGNPLIRKAFDHEFFMLGKSLLPGAQISGIGAAYDIDNMSDLEDQHAIVKDGLAVFQDLFGYEANYFTAPGLIFHSDLEQAFQDTLVSLIDVSRIRSMPLGKGRFKRSINFTGQRSAGAGTYVVRNAVFETNNGTNDGIDVCLAGINRAFQYGQPAIISNHRASFVGGLDIRNRDRGLRALNVLLSRIIEQFPEVEFISIRGIRS